MDPNELLKEIRRLIKVANLTEDDEALISVYRDMQWRFEELDEWLCKGGFTPKDWE
jgi:hypothetical protein